MPFKTYKPSKSDQARAVAAQLKAEGKPVRPKTVLDILARRGVVMDPGQCSKLTGEFRKRPKRARCRAAAKVQTVTSKSAANERVSYENVALAAQFAHSCGGIYRAQQALVNLAKVLDPIALLS